jgi:hypothetical protein
MESKSSATSIRLTPEEINLLLAQKLGSPRRGARAKYARRIRKHKSTVKRIIDGEIGGLPRKRLAEFLGVTEAMLPKKDFVS